jgi:non-ribosomal peptide synthetase component F
LIGEVNYNTDLFEAATARRLGDHFVTLAEAFAANPERHILDVPLAHHAAPRRVPDSLAGAVEFVF